MKRAIALMVLLSMVLVLSAEAANPPYLYTFVSDGRLTTTSLTIEGGVFFVGIHSFNREAVDIVLRIPYQPNGGFSYLDWNSTSEWIVTNGLRNGFLEFEGQLPCHIQNNTSCSPLYFEEVSVAFLAQQEGQYVLNMEMDVDDITYHLNPITLTIQSEVATVTPTPTSTDTPTATATFPSSFETETPTATPTSTPTATVQPVHERFLPLIAKG